MWKQQLGKPPLWWNIDENLLIEKAAALSWVGCIPWASSSINGLEEGIKLEVRLLNPDPKQAMELVGKIEERNRIVGLKKMGHIRLDLILFTTRVVMQEVWG